MSKKPIKLRFSLPEKKSGINNKRFLAIIPARSGSKGLKDKNIKELNGKPMMAYTIEAACKSKVFEDIIVSTDSKKYASIANKYGASVPFLRPNNLATDQTSTIDVLEYTLFKLIKMGSKFDYFVLLQPTSPLRDELDILNSIELLFEKKANAIISVCETDYSPLFSNTLDASLSMSKFIKREHNTRRQDLPKYYRINGAIYISEVDNFLENKTFYGEKSFAYLMDRKNSIDIDEEIDVKIAEIFLKEMTV